MGSYSGSREIEIELYKHGRDWCQADDDEPIPSALSRFIDKHSEASDEPASIMFEMTWNGSYTPACTWRAPEDCYPEESEEERDWETPELVIGYYDAGEEPRKATIPPEVLKDKDVTAWFEAIIDAEEITADDYYYDE